MDFEHIYTTEQRAEKLAEKKKEFAQLLTKIPGKKKKAGRAISELQFLNRLRFWRWPSKSWTRS